MTTDADTITQATKVPLRLAFGMAGLSVAALLGAFSMSEKVESSISSLGNSTQEMAIQVTRIGTQLESVSTAVGRISDTLLRETSSLETHLEALEARVRELEKTQ